MTYHNATKYLIGSPDEMIETTPGARIRALWDFLDQPQRPLKYVRLAGSSGKTVCAEMLVSCLKQTEFTVGCLITPLRQEIRENIRINGIPLSFEQMAAYVEQVYRGVVAINKKRTGKHSNPPDTESDALGDTPFQLTKYEILLTAALLAFRDHHCDLCILESDHTHADPTRFLPSPFAAAICGTIPNEDRKEIGRIRSYIGHGIQEIVSAPQNQDAYHVISDTCASINCRLTIPTKSSLSIQRLSLSGSEFTYREKSYRLSLCGKFQVTNAIVVLEILEMLARRGFALSYEQIADGLLQTKIPAKFEILSVSPTIIADSTHSEIAVETICDSMTEFRSILGTNVRLLLPNDALAKKYDEVLTGMGYTVEKTILLDEHTPKLLLKKRIGETISTATKNLSKDTVLMISGPFAFTSQIRYELLKQLGF